jgi:hypothetical protein
MNMIDYIVLGGIAVAVVYATLRILGEKGQKKSCCSSCSQNSECKGKNRE